MITVRFFASLREQLGTAEQRIPANAARTVAEAWRAAAGDRPLPDNTLAAVNQEYADPDTPLQAGDEVAFFPPVTGG